VTYLPPLQTLLGTVSVPPGDAVLIIGAGAAFFAVIELEKRLRLALRSA
jgi:hypothetical protein